MVHVSRKTSPPTVEAKTHTNGKLMNGLSTHLLNKPLPSGHKHFKSPRRCYARLPNEITSGHVAFLRTISTACNYF